MYARPSIELALCVLALSAPTAHGRPPVPDGSGQPVPAYLKAINGESGDSYAQGILAVSGSTLIVGAVNEDSGSQDPNDNSATVAGAVYVFANDGLGWSHEAYLKSPAPDAFDFFGRAAAVDGDTLVVGASGEDGNAVGVNGGDPADNSVSGSGAAFVYRRAAGVWSLEAYLKASNAQASDGFGFAVGISGDVIAVGAGSKNGGAGAVYVFRRTGTEWVEEACVEPINSTYSVGFGTTVAVEGDTLLIGDPNENNSSSGVNGNPNGSFLPDSGAVYVHRWDGATWGLEAYLKASNPGNDDRFGFALDLSGDIAVVGAIFEQGTAQGINGPQNDGGLFRGAAYVFERTGTTWAQTAYVKAPNNTQFQNSFGHAVAASGNRILVGARADDSPANGINGDPFDIGATDSGAAFLYELAGGTWSQIAYLKSSHPDSGDGLGISVALEGSRIALGAGGEDGGALGVGGDPADNSAPGTGAVFVYELGEFPTVYCSSKFSSAGCGAQISATDLGSSPISGASDYSVTACGVQEFKNGLLFASLSGSAAIPFSGGVLCMNPPTKRGPVLNSGGDDPLECDGGFNMLVNDGVGFPAGFDAGPGNTAWLQWWYRDPANGIGLFATALSNAIELNFQ